MQLDELIQRTVGFRRPVYEMLRAHFAAELASRGQSSM
jgi:hypothetical protein